MHLRVLGSSMWSRADLGCTAFSELGEEPGAFGHGNRTWQTLALHLKSCFLKSS